MVAAPVRYQRLRDVETTPAYTGLNKLQKAVVDLLFIYYEYSHFFDDEDDEDIMLYHYVRDLYYTEGVQNVRGLSHDDFRDILRRLLLMDADETFKRAIGEGLFVRAMDAIMILNSNIHNLPVYLPVAVVPHNGPNIWVAEEHRLDEMRSEEAIEIANDVEDADAKVNPFDEKTLRRYINILAIELRNPVWELLRRHGEGIPNVQEAYAENRQSIERALTKATTMLEDLQKPHKKRKNSNSNSKHGGKQTSKMRTMRRRRQQYKRRRRTLRRR